MAKIRDYMYRTDLRRRSSRRVKRVLLTSIPVAFILLFIIAGLSNCSLSKKVDDDIMQKKVAEQRLRAWNLLEAGKPDSAAMLYARVAGMYMGNEQDKELLTHYGVAMVNMGYIWLYERKNSEQAYVWLERGRQIGEKYDLPSVKIGAYDNLGKIYANYGCFDKAENFYRLALNESIDARLEWGVPMCLTDLINLALSRGDISSVKNDVRMVNGFRFDDRTISAYCRPVTHGLLKWFDGNPGEGAGLIAEASDKTKAMVDSSRYAASLRMLLGEALRSSGYMNKGMEYLYEARTIADADSLDDLLEIACELLASAHQQSGRPDSASLYNNQAIMIRDSLFNASNFGRVRDLEIAAVQDSLQRQVLQEQSHSSHMRHILWLTLLASIIIIVFAVWLAFNYRRVRRTNLELYKRNMELASDTHIPVAEPEDAVTSETDSAESHLKRSAGERAASIMASSPEVFSPEFTIERLAELSGIRTRQLADALIDATGKNFKTLLTECRVREACRLLADNSTLRLYSIEAVAEKVGYRSRTHFARVFKDVTGMTASEFAKQAKAFNHSKAAEIG